MPEKSLRAADMKMSDEQRIKVMMLVKEGRLSVDQAMDKVMKVEEEIAGLHSPVSPLCHSHQSLQC